MTTPSPIADRLLDAQVAWVVSELSGPRLLEVVERDVDTILTAAADVRVDAVATPEDVVAVVELLLSSVPPSEVVTAMAEATADQVHDGPAETLVPSDVLPREQVTDLVDASLALRPLVGQALDRLTDSPAIGTLASRFVTRLVVDVLEANRSMASRIPGVGSLVSFGTNAATKMVGVADKQVQALLGSDTGGKGTAMAVRRLNSVVMSTLEDPLFREAMLEAWDTWADEPLDGIGDVVAQGDLRRIAAAVQAVVVTGAPTPPVRAFIGAWVQTFFDLHGGQSVTDVLRALGLGRDEVLAVALRVVPPVVDAAAADGVLEEVVRARLAPFFHSDAVAVILADAQPAGSS